nr:reverse transcriptase domain-containing protein [Tanacetum cinerariifolium]
MCDVHLVNNPTPFKAKDHFEIVINSNDDYSSSDDDSLYYENIEYVEAPPHDFEFVSLEVEKIVIQEDEKIEDDNLREKLLKVNDAVLKIFSGKLKSRWSGPFTISHVFPYGTVELTQPDGPNFKVNGHRLKHYFREDLPKCKPMRERGYASWERAQRHMGRSSECFGTVQMSCRCTG